MGYYNLRKNELNSYFVLAFVRNAFVSVALCKLSKQYHPHCHMRVSPQARHHWRGASQLPIRLHVPAPVSRPVSLPACVPSARVRASHVAAASSHRDSEPVVPAPSWPRRPSRVRAGQTGLSPTPVL